MEICGTALGTNTRIQAQDLSHSLSPAQKQGLKMNSMAGLFLLLAIVRASWEFPLLEEEDSSSLEAENTWGDEMRDLSNMKRHSEGTFSNDLSKYLEEKRAQDFVRWLMNNKKNGSATKRHAEGTFTSDVSSYLQDQAMKDFIAMLKSGQVRKESKVSRRHVDGSFTSDVNKVLDALAAKEFLLWVMASKSSGERKKRQDPFKKDAI